MSLVEVQRLQEIGVKEWERPEKTETKVCLFSFFVKLRDFSLVFL